MKCESSESLHYENSNRFCRNRVHRNNRPPPDLRPIKKASAINFADLSGFNGHHIQ